MLRLRVLSHCKIRDLCTLRILGCLRIKDLLGLRFLDHTEIRNLLGLPNLLFTCSLSTYVRISWRLVHCYFLKHCVTNKRRRKFHLKKKKRAREVKQFNKKFKMGKREIGRIIPLHHLRKKFFPS